MDNKLTIHLLSKDSDQDVLACFAHLFPKGMDDLGSDWEFVGAFYEDTPCGILAYIIEDEIIIPWIFVDEAYRRRSIGSQMLEALLNDLVEKFLFTGFTCEIILNTDESGLDLIHFFASIDDFDIAPKYCIYEVSPDVYKDAFAKHTLFQNTQNIATKRFIDLLDYQKIEFMNIPKVADCYQIDQMKKWEEGIEKELSICIVDGDKVTGAILLTDMGEDRLSIEMIYANHTQALLELIVAFGNILMDKNNGKSLIFNAVNEKMLDLAKGLFSEISVCGEVWEASYY